MRIHDSGTLDPRTVDLKTQSLGPWAITSLSDCLGLWEMYTKTQIQFEDPKKSYSGCNLSNYQKCIIAWLKQNPVAKRHLQDALWRQVKHLAKSSSKCPKNILIANLCKIYPRYCQYLIIQNAFFKLCLYWICIHGALSSQSIIWFFSDSFNTLLLTYFQGEFLRESKLINKIIWFSFQLLQLTV